MVARRDRMNDTLGTHVGLLGRVTSGWPSATGPSVTREKDRSDRDRDLGDLTDVGGDLAVDGLGSGREGTKRPLAVAGEEPELTVLVGRHLGGELTRAVEEAHIGVLDGHRLTGGVRADDLALDDGLLGDVHAVKGQTSLDRSAHQASPAS